jgi:MFS family permease
MRAPQMALPPVRDHKRLLGAFGIDALGSGLFMPFSVLFFTATTPLSLQQVGLALSIAALIRLPATAGAGVLTDRLGSKRTVIASSLAQAFGFAGYLFVGSFPQVLASAIAVQVGNSLFWVAYPALVHQAPDNASQESWFALISAMRNAGLAVGALGASLAVAIGGTTGYYVVIAVNAASFVLAAMLIRLDPVSSERSHMDHPACEEPIEGWSAVLHDRPFLAFVAVNVGMVLLSLSFVIAVPVFLVTSADLPDWTPGTLLALNAVLGALGATYVVKVVTGRRRDHVLISSQVIIGAGYACILMAGLVPTVFSIAFAVLAAVFVTTTELIQGPVVSAIINESASDRSRGHYVSVYQMTFSIVDIVAPIALTTALTHGPFATWIPLIVIAGLDALALRHLAQRLPVLAVRIGHTKAAGPMTCPTESEGVGEHVRTRRAGVLSDSKGDSQIVAEVHNNCGHGTESRHQVRDHSSDAVGS